MQKQPLLKFLIPAFYLVAMALVVFNAWNEQRTVRQGSGSPLYRNLMENSARIRQGFDPAELREIPAGKQGWAGFKSTPLRVKNSLLPDLPKRPFLSPEKIDVREYTIIPVELDAAAMAFLDADPSVIPGIFI
ncbi:MAG: hypothetical protein LBI06_04170 [Treponema sp.]|nr:hypothetical protein [Treponema sp.]